VAAPPRRGAEPAPPARPRPAPQRRVLDSGPGLSSAATSGSTTQPERRTPHRDGRGELVVTPVNGVDRRINGLQGPCPSPNRPPKARYSGHS